MVCYSLAFKKFINSVRLTGKNKWTILDVTFSGAYFLVCLIIIIAIINNTEISIATWLKVCMWNVPHNIQGYFNK